MNKFCYNLSCKRRSTGQDVWQCSNAKGCLGRCRTRDQFENRVCGNCAGWGVENEVCCEARSEHCADFTSPGYSCAAWSESPEQ